jgi:predicted aldo/keto reductase-like oxidoreductase
VKHFHESLERLQLDHVDLLALHGINNHRMMWDALRPGGCLHEARKLQAQGLARHIGFSSHGSRTLIRQCLAHEEDGGFDYVNLHWYYIDQHNHAAIADAAARDIGVFIISPNDKGGMLYKPSDKLRQLCEPLHPIVFNALFCLANPDVHTMSLGASCPQDFELQLEALEHADTPERAAATIAPIVERLDAALAEAVGQDVLDGFREGLPGWEDTPGHINLPIVLRLRHLALGLDLTEYVKMRYNLLGNGGHWFQGLNARFAKELDFEKALADSPFKDQIPGWLVQAHELMGDEAVERLSQS